jgi:GTP cyclohydrolase II
MPTNNGRMAVRVYGERDRGEAFYSQHAWVACLWADCDDVYRGSERVHMRVHDACLTSEVLGSLKCDCAVQLRLAQQHLAQQGGILIYTPQEGRGIGLASKIAAYGLQERQGLDTVDANLALGLPDEARDYTPVRTILDSLGVRSVVLLTNNPFKVHADRKSVV